MACVSVKLALLALAAGLGAAQRTLQQSANVCLIPLTVVTTPQDKFQFKVRAHPVLVHGQQGRR